MGIVSLPAYAGTCSETVTAVAPTGVSMATSASGNYDNALIVTGNLSGVVENGEQWADKRVNIVLPAAIFLDSAYVFNGFIRATGAETFQWTLSLDSYTWLVGDAPDISGTGSLSQDCIGAIDGMGTTLNINSAPTSNDVVVLTMSGQAANSTGITNADQLGITINFL